MKRPGNFFFGILVLTEIWLYSGFLKRFCPSNSAAETFLWHFAYGPMLFMPGLWLGLVLSDFNLRKLRGVLSLTSIVAFVLLILVLLNDLHHWVWHPVYDSEGMITSWKAGPLYFGVSGFIFLILFSGILALIYGTINKRNRPREVLFLFLPLVLFIVYTVLYALGVSFIRKTPFLNNYYLIGSLLGFLLMEIALRSGLFQNSGFYRSYFVKGPYRLALAYPDGTLFARNEAFTMSPEILKTDQAEVGNARYRKESMEGGYLLIEEDMSDVLRLQKELLAKQSALQKTMAYLSKRTKVEQEIDQLALHETLSASLLKEIDQERGTIERLVNRLPDHLNENSGKSCTKILEELQNRLAFLKQRCLFLIQASPSVGLSYEDFSLSLGSLQRDLENVGFTLAVTSPSFTSLPLEEALRFNAFFRSLIEAFGEDRGAVLISYDPVHDSYKVRITPSGHFDPSKILFEPKLSEEDGDYFLSLGGAE
jgi:hypothetical protein